MRLDMISRRRFLKSAGAAALAVAAAGVLAGCDGGDSSSKVPGTDTPNVPEVTSKQVKIIFADVPRNPTGKIEKPKLRKRYCVENLVAKESGVTEHETP